MVGVLLILAGGAQPAPAVRTSEPVPLHVRVYAGRGMDLSTVERSQAVARRLLTSAGIDLVWRLCEPAAVCDPGTRPPREIPILLSAEALKNGHEVCGRAAVASAGSGTVRVSVPCVAGVAARLAVNRGGTVHPLLKVARFDDVLGAVEAHELGHVLGLKHGRGVMQARLDANDIVALRLGNLVFSASQGARMQTLLMEQTGEESLPTRPDDLLALDPPRLLALVAHSRPAPVPAATRLAALQRLPAHGEATNLDDRSTRKLGSLSRGLRAAQRDAIYALKVIDVPQAVVANYFAAAILVSRPALDLLEEDELEAVVAHEVAHEYVWAEYERASAQANERRLRELELVCDAIAVVTQRAAGIDPSALARAIERISRYNRSRLGQADNERRYPTVDERRRLIQLLTKRLPAPR